MWGVIDKTKRGLAMSQTRAEQDETEGWVVVVVFWLFLCVGFVGVND